MSSPNPVEVAAVIGNFDMMRSLLERQNYDPKQKGIRGRTLLHCACIGGHLDIVKYLIDEHQVNPLFEDDGGKTPLHLACEHGHLDIVRYLVNDQSVDPDCASCNQLKPLYLACCNGHSEIVKFLIEKGCDYTQMFQLEGCAAYNILSLASTYGHTDVVRYLIEEKQCDPHQKIIHGRSLLHLACMFGHLDIVKYLIDEHQLDPLSEDDNEKTPFHLACEKGHLDVVRYLVNDQSVDPGYASGHQSTHLTPLHSACCTGHLEVVKFLIEEKGCDYTQTFQTEEGYVVNVLHLASMYGHLDVARYLIEEKLCDAMSKTDFGYTPLSLACQQGHLDVVKYLLVNESSIDPVYELNNGRTPLHLACSKGQLDTVKFLIEEKGCDPMYCSEELQQTPYAIACLHGHLDVVRYLTEERHCDPLAKDANGINALHLAPAAGNVDILKYFVEERGCDLEVNDTSLVTAIESGNLEVVQYLTSGGTSNTVHRQQDEVPQKAVQAADGHVFTTKDSLLVTGHPQETSSTPRKLRSSSRQLPPSGEPLPPQRKRKKQAAVRGHSQESCTGPQSSSSQLPPPGESSLLQRKKKKQDADEVPQQKKHSQETRTSSWELRSGSRQLLPSGELPSPQKKGKKQGANKMPQQKKQYTSDEPPPPKRKRMKQENEYPPPNVPLSGPPHLLNPDDLAFLMNYLQPIASHWNPIGLQLGLSAGELDIIAATPLLIPGGPVAFLQEVLKRWLNHAPPFPTLSKLCGALRSRTVNQSRLALDLQQHYQTRRTAQSWEYDPELKSLVKKAEPTGMQLGAGAYGSVEQVKIEGEMCAAKRFTMKIRINPNEFYGKFFAEFRILSSLCHPNIVQYHCVCPLPNSKLPALVMEQMQTNLHDYLLNPSYANLSLNAKVSILRDIARGLAYLHNHKPAVIHRDLSAKNILLSSERVAKISDFGNSRIIDIDPASSSEFKSTTHVPGTIIYMPPEACSDHAKFNEKLDIFSFGQLALFTATQVLPCNLLPANFCDDDGELHARTEVERRQTYIDQLEQQLHRDHDLIKLIKQCLHNSPKMRPTADEIVRVLKKIVATPH